MAVHFVSKSITRFPPKEYLLMKNAEAGQKNRYIILEREGSKGKKERDMGYKTREIRKLFLSPAHLPTCLPTHPLLAPFLVLNPLYFINEV